MGLRPFPPSPPDPLILTPQSTLPASRSLPFTPFSSPTSRPPKIQLGALGEHCKLQQRGLGRSPSRNRIWYILAVKYDIWWQQF